MKQQYDEIMEHIEVTEEMRSRILQNIRNAPTVPPKKPIRFSQILRVGTAAAACAAVILVGSRGVLVAGLGSTGMEKSEAAAQDAPSQEYAAAYGGILDYENAEELAAVGFEMPQLQTLPFTVESTRYASYWETMAEVEYDGQNGEWALLRKGAGEEPVSGDYNAYPVETEIALNSQTSAQLKGTEDGYTLAEWTVSEYAYSLQLSEAQDISWWQSTLEALEQQGK